MKFSRHFYFWLGAMLFVSMNACQHECEDLPDPGPGPSCDTNDVTYAGSVYPIFLDNCISCHSGPTPEGNLNLTDYEQVAFVAESGTLLGALRHEQGYSPMPKNGPRLDACLIDIIEIWVRDTTFTGGETPHPCDPDTVYFEMDLLPILRSGCAQPGCHDAAATAGIRLDSYAAVMASEVIDPFDPDGSELYEKITETDPEKRMPPPPRPQLEASQIALVNKWIEQGAQNLFCDEACDSVNVTFSGTIWEEIIFKHCFGCHKGPIPQGGLSLENYEDVAAIANDGRLLGVVTHAGGYPQMPKNAPMLTDCKIAQIRKWIDDGIPNN